MIKVVTEDLSVITEVIKVVTGYLSVITEVIEVATGNLSVITGAAKVVTAVFGAVSRDTRGGNLSGICHSLYNCDDKVSKLS
jgi:hypothetical protein